MTDPDHISESTVDETDERQGVPVQERPRICLIDVESDCVETLTSRGFNCYSGTLGALVEVPNRSKGHRHQCLLNFDFPPNLHEYDIVVVDLQKQNKVPYSEKEHTRFETKGHEQTYSVSSYPETVFDPRPFSASILGNRLRPLVDRESILVVFATTYETACYHLVTITPDGTSSQPPITYASYDFYRELPSYSNDMGVDTSVVSRTGSELAGLLERHNSKATYSITFKHPTHWDSVTKQPLKDKDFFPLMEADSGQIIAFVRVRERNFTFFFPRINDKASFLADLCEKVLPDILPAVFPYSTRFDWLKNAQYRLPNEAELLDEKEQLCIEHEAKLRDLDDKIAANKQEYGFLHNLLTQSGAELVKTVERYLEWLGFKDVVNVDDTDPELNEEDLRVDTDKRLLVIEVKGLAGTSTDSDCSQISKIRLRRMKERQTFDVFALYLVNHQRHLPPETRRNPPFNKTQIQDAKSDDRGLLTTYELFKLYFNVEGGYISRKDARDSLYRTGLVEFVPSRCVLIPQPYELHYDGQVVVFKSEGLHVRTGMSVVLNDKGMFRSDQISEIRVDGESVEEADSGEVGIKLTEMVSKETEVWLQHDQ